MDDHEPRLGLYLLLASLGLSMVACNMASNDGVAQGVTMPHRQRIVLLGASVGKAWDLPDFPKRVNIDNEYIFETVTAYQYDKTEALEEILMRPKRKFHPTRTYIKGFFKPSPQLPNTIILKECAAYFPGDLSSYKTLMKRWVTLIRERNIKVILATTVPVTSAHAAERKGRMASIREYNDWIRDYAKNENIPLLDLEAALRTDEKNRFLKNDLAVEDGLHLNQKAYGILDNVLRRTVETAS